MLCFLGFISQYLNTACDFDDQKLPDELVGPLPQWFDSENAVVCTGSIGMAACIADVPGTVGYLDPGYERPLCSRTDRAIVSDVN